MSKSSIHLYELGKRNPKQNALEELSCLFNVDIDYLLGKTDVRNAAANSIGFHSLEEAYKNGALKMTMAENIKYLRLKHGLTQEQLGEVAGTTKQAIYKYETGIVTNIPTDKIEKLSALFGVSPSYLMGWDDEQKEKPPSGDISEGERLWNEMYHRISDDTKRIIIMMVDKLEELSEYQRKMFLLSLGGLKNQEEA
jgi:transcriptional regulator with XRE-family HTH domain